MNTLSKVDVASLVAGKLGVTKRDALAVTEEVFGTILDILKEGNSVSIAKFGKFDTKVVEAHSARNPQTGETIEVPEKIKPTFSYSSTVKRELN